MLKSAYQAPDEFTAITIRELLAANGIEAVIRRLETTWLDGLPKILRGYWGDVLVAEENLTEAEACVQEFLKETEQGPGLTEPDPDKTEDNS